MSNLKTSTQSTINALVKKGQIDKARQIKKDIEAMYNVTGLRLPKA
jgi:pentatricopeptide repeat protein